MKLDKKTILDRVVKAKSAGWTISEGTWVDAQNKCCCALGACLVTENPQYDDSFQDPVLEAAILFDTDETTVNSFAFGFDGEREPGRGDSVLAWELGREVRKATLNA